VSLSLDPPYNFLFFTELVFVCFLKISLKTVYPTIEIDGKRCRKIGKDGGCIVECRVSCVANAHKLINYRFSAYSVFVLCCWNVMLKYIF